MSTRLEQKEARRQERIAIAEGRRLETERDYESRPRTTALALIEDAMPDVRIKSAVKGNWQGRIAVAAVYALFDIADAIRGR